ncbi:MAG TPA: single-stranded-DNA-specific exonuclease RecJ [Bacillota bacterium]|jgi:single-stranded-DNA-specific exonuclease|nr:single-stranded-DNA-specific exonuclease RecJ [Bacillota bacterium]HQB81372.1 single-stranded-DNA-specific exonuclease RecJ [Bacillota bacterium]
MQQEISKQELLNWLMPVPWKVAESTVSSGGDRTVLQRILEARGFDTEEKRNQLFHAALKDLPDPFLFRSMADACDLIGTHLEKQQPRFLIFGDYDADGLTAAALLARYFAELGHQPDILIPDRFDDGYGLSEALVDEIELHRPGLVITVDTGTSSPELIRDLKGRGIDVIVTDHHLETSGGGWTGVPLINPALAGETYPFRHLSGAGVAFMLTLALDRKLGRVADSRPGLLVLASVGTVADVMPLVDANRILVREGLKEFEKFAPQGLKAVDRLVRTGRELMARDIAFSLAPRLNAAGRMGDVRLALDLLLEDDPERADYLAGELDRLNQQRRLVEQEIFSQAIEAALESAGGAASVALAVGRNWHAGVMGIVSSRLAEKLRVPAITLNEDEEGILTGSARSFGNLDLIEVIRSAAPLLEKFGGHAGAAGLTLRAENLQAFRRQITEAVEAIPRSVRQKPLLADIALTGDQFEIGLVRQFDALEPTGSGFERPLICMEDLTVDEMTFVSDGRHLKFSLRTSDPSARVFDALLFNRSNEGVFYSPGDRVEIMAIPEINRWRDKETIQMRLIEIRPGRHQQINEQAVREYRQWTERGRLEGGSLSLSSSLFGPLWQTMEALCGGRCPQITFLPVRLAWLLSHRYNRGVRAPELLLALAILDEAGLVLLKDNGDGSFTCTKLEQGGKRPALSDSHLWGKLKELGVIVE